MGFYMWIINIVFLLNPFRILNYEGRRYFIRLFIRVLLTFFFPMNANLFFMGIIIGSFVQPFSDLAFTACKATDPSSSCLFETKLATYIFTMTYLILRFAQSVISHRQFGEGRFCSRPNIGLMAVLLAMNTVTSSFVYGFLLDKGLEIYWICAATIGSLFGIYVDMRADWGLISFHK